MCDRLLLAGFLGEKLALTAREVDEVAVEMKEEQRSGRRASAARLVSSPKAEAVESMEAAVSGALAKVIAHPELANEFSRLAGEFDASRVEARLAHLEQTVSTLLSLMNRIVVSESDPDKDQAVK